MVRTVTDKGKTPGQARCFLGGRTEEVASPPD
jgi:hypothetical protein